MWYLTHFFHLFYNRIQITFCFNLLLKFNHFISNENLNKFHLRINWLIHSFCSIVIPKSSNWLSRFHYVLSDSNTGPVSEQEGQHTTNWAGQETLPNCTFWTKIYILCCRKVVTSVRDSRLLSAVHEILLLQVRIPQ